MYAKIYASMWDGTLGQQWEAWTTFVYLLANCDKEGFIDKTPESISASSGLPLTVVLTGLKILEQPDHRSRRPDQDGCRLERIDDHRDWGWRIVNYEHYRTLVDADLRRHQLKEAQQRRRLKLKKQRESSSVINCHQPSSQAEAEVEAVSDPNGSSCHPLGDDLSVDDWFNQYLWPVCPRRRGCSKAKALRACRAVFRSTPKSQHDALGDTMIAGILAYAASVEGRDPEHIAHPATLINGRIWETLHEPA